MPYIVRRIEGLPRLQNPPQRIGEYLAALSQHRRREIESMWQQLASELELSGADRKRADAAVVKLHAVGVLILPDWLIELVDLKRLLGVRWVKVWQDLVLPRPWVAHPKVCPFPPQPWHLDAINKPRGFDGSGVSVGVIDSGYEPTYSELNNAFAATFAQYVGPGAGETIGKMVPSPNASDLSGIRHGSKVCVMLAGPNNGVAPKASVLMASIWPDDGVDATRSMVALALEWLLEFPHPATTTLKRPSGCDIITLSVATSPLGSSDPGSDVAGYLASAEEYKTLVVAAIGNSPIGVGLNAYCAPGADATVIGVGAVDDTLTVTEFSGYGTTAEGAAKPDLVAPGRGLLFPIPNNAADEAEGTSFAAPIVAGAAALLLQKDPTLRDSVQVFRTTLLGFADNTAVTSANAGDSGQGVLNLNGL